jgi:hypothetical protein
MHIAFQSASFHPWIDDENRRAMVFGFSGNWAIIHAMSCLEDTMEEDSIEGP